MKQEKENHLQSLKLIWLSLADAKYRAGAEEHNDNLFDLNPIELIDEAIAENIDEFIYLQTLKEKIIASSKQK